MVDGNSLGEVDKRVVRVLAKVDISKGLIPKLEVVLREKYLIKKVDYWKVPFK